MHHLVLPDDTQAPPPSPGPPPPRVKKGFRAQRVGLVLGEAEKCVVETEKLRWGFHTTSETIRAIIVAFGRLPRRLRRL